MHERLAAAREQGRAPRPDLEAGLSRHTDYDGRRRARVYCSEHGALGSVDKAVIALGLGQRVARGAGLPQRTIASRCRVGADLERAVLIRAGPRGTLARRPIAVVATVGHDVEHERGRRGRPWPTCARARSIWLHRLTRPMR